MEDLKKKKAERDRLAKLQEKTEAKLTVLTKEILQIKKQKVDVVKKMTEEKKQFQLSKKIQAQEMERLKRENAKLASTNQQKDAIILRKTTELQKFIVSKRTSVPLSTVINPISGVPPLPKDRIQERETKRGNTTPSSRKRSRSNPPAIFTKFFSARWNTSSPSTAPTIAKPPKFISKKDTTKSVIESEINRNLKKMEAQEILEKDLKKREQMVKEVEKLKENNKKKDNDLGSESEMENEIQRRIESLETTIDFQNDKIQNTQNELLILTEAEDKYNFFNVENFQLDQARALLKESMNLLLLARQKEDQVKMKSEKIKEENKEWKDKLAQEKISG